MALNGLQSLTAHPTMLAARPGHRSKQVSIERCLGTDLSQTAADCHMRDVIATATCFAAFGVLRNRISQHRPQGLGNLADRPRGHKHVLQALGGASFVRIAMHVTRLG